jgi:hypothetical protein
MTSVMVLREYKANVKIPTSSLHQHHAMKTYVEGSYSSTLLDLSTRWRTTVSFTTEEIPRNPLHRSLDGSQNPSGCFRAQKTHLSITGNSTPCRPARRFLLYRLSPLGSFSGRIGTYNQYSDLMLYFACFL